MEKRLPLYADVFLNKLKVSGEFLDDNAKFIRDKLRFAIADFDRDPGDIFGTNQCLHLASSVILSNPDYLRETLSALRGKQGLSEKDLTTVLAVIALYYLVQWDSDRVTSEEKEAKTEEDKKKAEEYGVALKRLRIRFDSINWLIGRDVMRVLEFETR